MRKTREILPFSDRRSPGAVLCLLTALLIALAALPLAAASRDGEEEESIGRRIADYCSRRNISPRLIVVFISALPIVELRGSVLVAHSLFEMNPVHVYLLAVLGNMIPVVPILLLLGPASRLCMRCEAGRRFFEWFFERARRKSATVQRFELFGLSLFVAIPLPVTGAWTGCAVAFLMGIRFVHALWAILLGVMISGGIMTAVALGIVSLGWWILIPAAALLAFVSYALSRPPERSRDEPRGT